MQNDWYFTTTIYPAALEQAVCKYYYMWEREEGITLGSLEVDLISKHRKKKNERKKEIEREGMPKEREREREREKKK